MSSKIYLVHADVLWQEYDPGDSYLHGIQHLALKAETIFGYTSIASISNQILKQEEAARKHPIMFYSARTTVSNKPSESGTKTDPDWVMSPQQLLHINSMQVFTKAPFLDPILVLSTLQHFTTVKFVLATKAPFKDPDLVLSQDRMYVTFRDTLFGKEKRDPEVVISDDYLHLTTRDTLFGKEKRDPDLVLSEEQLRRIGSDLLFGKPKTEPKYVISYRDFYSVRKELLVPKEKADPETVISERTLGQIIKTLPYTKTDNVDPSTIRSGVIANGIRKTILFSRPVKPPPEPNPGPGPQPPVKPPDTSVIDPVVLRSPSTNLSTRKTFVQGKELTDPLWVSSPTKLLKLTRGVFYRKELFNPDDLIPALHGYVNRKMVVFGKVMPNPANSFPSRIESVSWNFVPR